MQKQPERAAVDQLVEQARSVPSHREIRRYVRLAGPAHGQGVNAVGQIRRKLRINLIRRDEYQRQQFSGNSDGNVRQSLPQRTLWTRLVGRRQIYAENRNNRACRHRI